jgi:hypothetical protein
MEGPLASEHPVPLSTVYPRLVHPRDTMCFLAAMKDLRAFVASPAAWLELAISTTGMPRHFSTD